MVKLDRMALRFKPFRQFLGDEYRTVPAPGAANGDRQVAPILPLVERQEEADKVLELPTRTSRPIVDNKKPWPSASRFRFRGVE